MTMRILEKFSQQHVNGSSEVPIHAILSKREIEILQEIAMGASNSEIATKLFLSVNTVKHHVHNILAKLGLENRREAIQYAHQAGLTQENK
jgi:NarL family two-component system response regulator LiaR